MSNLRNPIYRFRHTKVVQALEEDPEVQLKFHLFFSYFWLLNMIGVFVMLFCFPKEWKEISIVYIAIISQYANFATDYDAVAASKAAVAAERLLRHAAKSESTEQVRERPASS